MYLCASKVLLRQNQNKEVYAREGKKGFVCKADYYLILHCQKLFNTAWAREGRYI